MFRTGSGSDVELEFQTQNVAGKTCVTLNATPYTLAIDRLKDGQWGCILTPQLSEKTGSNVGAAYL